MYAMQKDPFEELRQQMIAVIVAETVFASGELGKAALATRVLEAMAKVPRHEFAQQAKRRLAQRGCANIELRIGNGFYGWPEHAPFDKIIVTAGTDLVPPSLLNQLKPNGRMVIPTGLPDAQHLVLVEKDANGRIKTKQLLPVRFSLLEGTEPSAAE